MGRRGPIGKSRKAKELSGNPGKRRLVAGAVIPPGEPECPDWLSDAARSEWDRVLGLLMAFKVLTRLDADILALYASTFATWRKTVETLQREGCTYDGPTGLKKQHPAVIVEAALSQRLVALMKEIAATPAARLRMGIESPDGAEEQDSVSSFARKRG